MKNLGINVRFYRLYLVLLLLATCAIVAARPATNAVLLAVPQDKLVAFKTDILANTNTIPAGQVWSGTFAGVQVKNVPNTGDGNFAVAGWYNQEATPTYFVWRTSLSRAVVYHTTSPDATNWNWTTYKNQAVTEQNAWTQMYMGDEGPIGNLNFRQGVAAIFTGSAPQTAQRDHVFSVGRRRATFVEKLFGVAVLSPPANTGNNAAQPRGSATNPDNLGFEGVVTGEDVQNARNS